jgi:hypothetical protein
MDSPEGKGIARRAWDAYVKAVDKVTRPYTEPFARMLAEKVSVPVAMAPIPAEREQVLA